MVEHIDDVGAYGSGGMGVMSMAFTGGYRVPAGIFSSRSCRTNTMSRAAYRGPWMFETVVREVMVDVVARGLGLDPLEVRRRNVLHESDLPYRTPMGSVLSEITPADTLEQAVGMLDYDAFRVEQAQARSEGRHLGVGISLFVEPNSFGAGLPGTEATVIRIEPDGMVQVITSASSQGHSVETTLAQIVADQLGVAVDDVVVRLGDTASAPVGSATGGSRNGVIAGGAALQAAGELRATARHRRARARGLGRRPRAGRRAGHRSRHADGDDDRRAARPTRVQPSRPAPAGHATGPRGHVPLADGQSHHLLERLSRLHL